MYTVKTFFHSDKNKNQEGVLSWEDYFMATAFLAAKRSKDPCTQVGACIVNTDKRIVGVGYNGMPTGCSDDQFPWDKEPKKPKLNTKSLYGKKSAQSGSCSSDVHIVSSL